MTKLSIKIKDNLARKIYKISKETNRDSSYHFNKAMENYLEELSDLNIAKRRSENKNDKLISAKELKKSLGILK